MVRADTRQYQRRFPDKIHLRLAASNQNNNRAWGEAIVGARGKYVALLDGDDYWTSPRKLQLQVRFLETHPECAICFHNALIIFDDGRETQLHNPDQQKTFSTIEDLWERNFMATCSVMFRAGLTPALPNWFWGMRFGDWPLHLLNAEHGTIGYLPDVMAPYRRHAGGVFGERSRSGNWKKSSASTKI